MAKAFGMIVLVGLFALLTWATWPSALIALPIILLTLYATGLVATGHWNPWKYV